MNTYPDYHQASEWKRERERVAKRPRRGNWLALLLVRLLAPREG